MRLGAVQSLRGIAALLVVADHGLELQFGDLPIAHFFGMVGVSTFFAISGLIMVETAKWGEPVGFWWRRIARVVPIYWFYTFLALAKPIVQHRPLPSLSAFAQSLLFIPHLNAEGTTHPFYGVGWTLNYEMFFYLIFGLALFFPRRLGLIGLAALFAILLVVGNVISPFMLDEESKTAVETWTRPIIALFLAGVGLGIAHKRWSIPMRRPLLAVLALLILASVAFMGVNVVRIPFVWLAPIWIACVALVGVCALTTDHVTGPVSKWTEWLGDASYSLYLCHVLVLWAVAFVLQKLHAPWLIIAIGVPTALLAAYASHRFIELPLQNLLRGRPKRAALAPAA